MTILFSAEHTASSTADEITGLVERRTALLLGLLACITYATNVNFMLNGDAVMYANYVLLGKFDDLTLHIGYYGLMYFLQHTIGRVADWQVHETITYANVVIGGFTVAVSYRLALQLLKDHVQAIIAATIFALCGRVILNATNAEIYMLQALLVLSSFLSYVHDRPAFAGALAGGAMLTSPLSAFAFLFFPVWEWTRPVSPRWRNLAMAAALGAVVYVPYLLVHGQELLHGRRGLLVIRKSRPPQWTEIPFAFATFQFKHYTALLLLGLAALPALRHHRRFLLLALATSVPHVYVLSRINSEEHTFILNTDIFFACALAIGAGVLLRHRMRVLVVVAGLAHIGMLGAAGLLGRGPVHRALPSELREVGRSLLTHRPAVMISDWNGAMALTYYARDSVRSLIEEDPLFAQMYFLDEPAPWPRPANPDLYLLETWSVSQMARLFRSAAQIEQSHEWFSVQRRAERLLGLSCKPFRTLTHPVYRCSQVGPVTLPAPEPQ